MSGEIMRLHRQKHHQTHVTNYNTVLELLDSAMEKRDASAVVGLQSAIKFNGGGHQTFSVPRCFLHCHPNCPSLLKSSKLSFPGFGFSTIRFGLGLLSHFVEHTKGAHRNPHSIRRHHLLNQTGWRNLGYQNSTTECWIGLTMCDNVISLQEIL